MNKNHYLFIMIREIICDWIYIDIGFGWHNAIVVY